MRCRATLETPFFHHSLEALPNGDARHVHVLSRYKVTGTQLCADRQQGIGGHPELCQLTLQWNACTTTRCQCRLSFALQQLAFVHLGAHASHESNAASVDKQQPVMCPASCTSKCMLTADSAPSMCCVQVQLAHLLFDNALLGCLGAALLSWSHTPTAALCTPPCCPASPGPPAGPAERDKGALQVVPWTGRSSVVHCASQINSHAPALSSQQEPAPRCCSCPHPPQKLLPKAAVANSSPGNHQPKAR